MRERTAEHQPSRTGSSNLPGGAVLQGQHHPADTYILDHGFDPTCKAVVPDAKRSGDTRRITSAPSRAARALTRMHSATVAGVSMASESRALLLLEVPHGESSVANESPVADEPGREPSSGSYASPLTRRALSTGRVPAPPPCTSACALDGPPCNARPTTWPFAQ